MYGFAKSAGKWLRQSPRRKPDPVSVSGVRVATFNVWLDPYESERRCRAVLDILQREAPDVIALQEVTARFLQQLLTEPWIRAQYVTSRSRLLDTRYDVVMLSRLPVLRFASHTLTSDMGRKLHVLEIPTAQGRLAVAGVHLESMRERTQTRITQIDECIPILSRADFSIWLGDFNSAPNSDEDARIRTAFRDVWEELDGTPGYTRDTSKNAMLAKVKADRHQRIDRVLVRGQGFAPLNISLLGTTPLEGTAGQVFPSDHFGVLAELSAFPAASFAQTGE